jgi:hypothetical protein
VKSVKSVKKPVEDPEVVSAKSKGTGKPKKEKKEKKEKKVKDPNAPKRCQSAYFFFLAAKRAEIIETHNLAGQKASEVVKVAGGMWAAMDEEAKKPYQELADKDKERYMTEKAAYTPQEPEEAEEEAEEAGEAEAEEEAPAADAD